MGLHVGPGANGGVQAPQIVASQGEVLCKRTKEIFLAAEQLEEKLARAKRNWSGVVTGVGTVLKGAVNVVSGYTSSNHFDAAVGTGELVVGAHSLYNIFADSNNSELVNLLKDTESNNRLIKSLEEANRESISIVTTNLNALQFKLANLNQTVSQIRSIASEGSKSVEAHKKEAAVLIAKAEEQYAEAQKAFKECQKQIEEADAKLEKAMKCFQSFNEVCSNESKDVKERAAQFKAIASELFTICTESKRLLDQSKSSLSTGIKHDTQAHDLHIQAAVLAGKAMQEAQTRQEFIAAISQKDDECEKHVKVMASELKDMQARNGEIDRLCDAAIQKLDKAQQLADAGWTTADLVAGATGASIIAPVTVPVGVTGAGIAAYTGATWMAAGAVASAFAAPVLAGLAAASVVHYRHPIAAIAHRVMYGKLKEKEFTALAPKVTENVQIAFDNISTGLIGKLRGKAHSDTEGDGVVILGTKRVAIPFRFDLSRKGKEDAVREKYLLTIQKEMKRQLKANELQPEECLKILKALSETIVAGKRPLINKESEFFGEIKRLCVKASEKTA